MIHMMVNPPDQMIVTTTMKGIKGGIEMLQIYTHGHFNKN